MYVLKYQKDYRYKNQKQKKNYNKIYYQKNKDTICKSNKKYAKKYNKIYYQKHKEKELNRTRNWIKKNPIKLKKYKSKRRNLGYNPINKPFKGSNGHHFNKDDVIYIPKDLHNIYHNVFIGYNMIEINSLAFTWLENEGRY